MNNRTRAWATVPWLRCTLLDRLPGNGKQDGAGAFHFGDGFGYITRPKPTHTLADWLYRRIANEFALARHNNEFRKSEFVPFPNSLLRRLAILTSALLLTVVLGLDSDLCIAYNSLQN